MGKVQRHEGANQADRWRRNARRRRLRLWRLRYLFPLVLVPLAAFLTVSPSSLDTVASLVPAGLLDGITGGGAAGCDIKGNISINTGERIYHVPGQMFYDDTVIRPEFGEQWFCSEAEARAAGWRKARR